MRCAVTALNKKFNKTHYKTQGSLVVVGLGPRRTFHALARTQYEYTRNVCKARTRTRTHTHYILRMLGGVYWVLRLRARATQT